MLYGMGTHLDTFQFVAWYFFDDFIQKIKVDRGEDKEKLCLGKPRGI